MGIELSTMAPLEKKVETEIELTPESVESAIKNQKPIEVKVQRSSGKIEGGWTVTGINSESGVARVWNVGKNIFKDVSLKELKKWNGKTETNPN